MSENSVRPGSKPRVGPRRHRSTKCISVSGSHDQLTRRSQSLEPAAIWEMPGKGGGSCLGWKQPSSCSMLPVYALALSAGFVLAILIGLSLFAQPIADDFKRAAEVKVYGIVGGVAMEYATWLDRWAADILHLTLSAVLDIRHYYGVALLAVTAGSAVLLHYFLGRAFDLDLRSARAVLVTSVFTALWWSASPSGAEIFFWRPGQLEYQFSFVAVAAFCIFVAERDLGTRTATGWQLGILAPCGFAITGLHELAGAFQAGLLLLIVLYSRYTTGRWHRAGIIALAATLVGLLVLLQASGNDVRFTYSASEHHLLLALASTASQTATSLALWLLDPKVILGTALLLMLNARGQLAPAWPERLPDLGRWAFPVVLVGSLAGLFAIPTFALMNTVPPRTLAAIHMVFLAGWLLVVLAWCPRVARPLMRPQKSGAFAVSALLVLFALALPASRNVVAGVLDLAGPAESFAAAVHARDRLLRRALEDGVRDAVVAPFPAATYPRSYIYNADIREDPDFWINRAFATFYGFESVRTTTTSQ